MNREPGYCYTCGRPYRGTLADHRATRQHRDNICRRHRATTRQRQTA